MRYCIFCGAEIPSSAAYCQICGRPQPDGIIAGADDSDEAATPQGWLEKITSSTKNMIIAGSCLFIVLLLVFTGVLLLIL